MAKIVLRALWTIRSADIPKLGRDAIPKIAQNPGRASASDPQKPFDFNPGGCSVSVDRRPAGPRRYLKAWDTRSS